MTDAEIITSLRACIEKDCDKCANCVINFSPRDCKENVMTLALDLINHKDAEIERLQSILLKFVREINNFENKHNIDTSDFSLIPILEEEKNNLVKQIKSEAIKEFAERLKEEIREILKDAYGERRKRIENLEQEKIFVGLDAVVKYCEGKIHSSERLYKFIDKLVKEMVGDTE